MIQLVVLHTTWLGSLIVASHPLRAYLEGYTVAKGRKYDDKARAQAHIAQFISDYAVDLDTVPKPLSQYSTLNEFFTREHKPGARPVCEPTCAFALALSPLVLALAAADCGSEIDTEVTRL